MEAPENTLEAFNLVKDKGFAYFECDVQFTSDNIPVILHDATINRTARNTDGSVIVGDIAINSVTYATASTYDYGVWFDEKYKGAILPKLEDVLMLCRRLDLHPYIEFKTSITIEQAEIIVNLVKHYGMINKVSYISYIAPALDKICDYDNVSRMAWLLAPASITQTNIDILKGFSTTNDIFIICADGNALTESMMSLVIDNDLELETVTYNNTVIKNLVNSSVVGIITEGINIAEILKNS